MHGSSFLKKKLTSGELPWLRGRHAFEIHDQYVLIVYYPRPRAAVKSTDALDRAWDLGMHQRCTWPETVRTKSEGKAIRCTGTQKLTERRVLFEVMGTLSEKERRQCLLVGPFSFLRLSRQTHSLPKVLLYI